MAKKKSSKRSASKKVAKKNRGYTHVKSVFTGMWLVLKYIGLGIWYFFKHIYIGIVWLAKLIVGGFSKSLDDKDSKVSKKESKQIKGELSSTEQISKINVVKTLKGKYDSFWSKITTVDSLIGIVIGARGSGKSAISLSIAENLRGTKKRFFAMGFPNSSLPHWITVVENVDAIENDAFVIVDEGGILFSSRESQSGANKLLSDLLFIARHKNLSILFVSQNSSNLEINTLRQADFLIFKKSSLLQKNFERKIVAKIYEEYSEDFEKYKNNKGVALLYSDDFIGFIENELPSFWSMKVSKSFR